MHICDKCRTPQPQPCRESVLEFWATAYADLHLRGNAWIIVDPDTGEMTVRPDDHG